MTTTIILTINEFWPDRTAPVGTFILQADQMPDVAAAGVNTLELVASSEGTASYRGIVAQGWNIANLTELGWEYHQEPDYQVGQEPIPPAILGTARLGMMRLGGDEG